MNQNVTYSDKGRVSEYLAELFKFILTSVIILIPINSLDYKYS